MHTFQGEHLRPELIPSMGGAVRTTLGGLDVSFKIDKEGELWINDVRIVAWRTEGKALIIALEAEFFEFIGLMTPITKTLIFLCC